MKKLLIVGALVFVVSFAFASKGNATLTSADSAAECPSGCSTAKPKCCTTGGGSAYYGVL
jgi:hypothetical protein